MKLKKYFMSIIPIIVIIIICLIYNSAKVKIAEKHNLTATFQYPDNSIGIEIRDFKGNPFGKNIQTINKSIQSNIKIINQTKYNSKFTLAAFIDYVQVPMIINNNSTTKISFNLDKYSKKNFKIKLNTYKLTGTHKLNFVLYNNSKIVRSYKNDILFEPVITMNNIISNNTVMSKTNILFDTESKAENLNIFKLNNQNYEDSTNKEMKITVNHDREVSIPINISSFSNAKDYIFWMTLNSEQLLIDSKLSYLYFNLPNGINVSKNITFKAPHEKGSYELVGFLSINPWLKKVDNKMINKVIYSPKIILVVN